MKSLTKYQIECLTEFVEDGEQLTILFHDNKVLTIKGNDFMARVYPNGLLKIVHF